jgi:hypothetical protein
LSTAPETVFPEPPYPAPEGSQWLAEPADPAEWKVAAPGSTCRYRGTEPLAHGAPASVQQRHGVTRIVWWNFCVPEHSGGYWAQAGQVWHWVLREAGSNGPAGA